MAHSQPRLDEKNTMSHGVGQEQVLGSISSSSKPYMHEKTKEGSGSPIVDPMKFSKATNAKHGSYRNPKKLMHLFAD